MKKIIVSVSLILGAILMISCSKSNSEQIDELMLPYSGDNPGAAVMVIKDGSIVFEKGYGLANLETKEKVTPATNFRLASVTKQFTAMSILMLIEKGKLTILTIRKRNSIKVIF